MAVYFWNTLQTHIQAHIQLKTFPKNYARLLTNFFAVRLYILVCVLSNEDERTHFFVSVNNTGPKTWEKLPPFQISTRNRCQTNYGYLYLPLRILTRQTGERERHFIQPDIHNDRNFIQQMYNYVCWLLALQGKSSGEVEVKCVTGIHVTSGGASSVCL